MNKLKITLNEDGSVRQFTPDFKIMRGSYRNVLINIEVPKSLLIDPVIDTDNNTNQTGNNVRVGAIIQTATGKNLETNRYEFQIVKEFTNNGIDYCLYQRKMPKEFTMWDTVNELEATNSGELNMVINVVNWTMGELNAKIEEIAASPTFTLDIYPSAFLADEEEIEDPSDFDELYSQVQNHDAQLQDIDADLYGTNQNTLGTYLGSRLKAGWKILLEQDSTDAPNNKIKISVVPINANEVPIAAITDLDADNVQEALRILSARSDNTWVDTVTGEDEYLVDNTDPKNPLINHDTSKVDKSVMEDAETPNGVVSSVGGDYFTDVNVDSMSLHIKVRSVINGAVLSDTAIPLKLASAISRGLMSKEDVATLSNLVTKVASLEGKASRYLYTDSTNPTASDIDTFVQAQGQVSPYEGVAVVVNETYHVWHFYENDNIGWKDDGCDTVNKATNTSLGIVIGSNENGKIFVETDGSMSVVGFDTLTNSITTLTNSKLDDVNVSAGTNNGTIKLTKTKNGQTSSTDNIPVKGLGSAAFTNSSAYATSTQGAKADSALQSETDPTVPSWAKGATKPSYTADEVGATKETSASGTKTSQIKNDASSTSGGQVHLGVTDSSDNKSTNINITKDDAKLITNRTTLTDDSITKKSDVVALINSIPVTGTIVYVNGQPIASFNLEDIPYAAHSYDTQIAEEANRCAKGGEIDRRLKALGG